MTTSTSRNEKITPFFIVQFCLVLIAMSAVVLRHGGWNAARLVGLCIAVPAAVLLFTARWQLGKSFSVTPQARELVTWGIYSKIRNPIYVFSALLLLGVLIALQYRYAIPPPAVAGSYSNHSRPSGGQGSRGQVWRAVQELQEGNLVLAGRIIISREV